MTNPGAKSKTIEDLVAVMAALRTPGTGCPWDLEQTFATIAPYTLEEAYEVADAIARDDRVDLREELGDLLLQVVYHARIAEEEGDFAFDDVVDGITRKMVRRHPHVFGTPEERAAGPQKGAWERIKAEEKAEKAAAKAVGSPIEGRAGGTSPGRAAATGGGLLADVPANLPALMRAVKLQDKAARVGFDWPSLAPVFDKMKEELAELEEVALAADPRGPATAFPHYAESHRQPAPPRGHPNTILPWVAGRGSGWFSLILKGNKAPQGASDNGSEDTNPERSGPSDRGMPDGPQPRRAAIEEEFGDLLFVMANVARHLKIDPEAALRGANEKFQRRFRHIESRLAEDGRAPADSNLTEMDALWDEAKARERSDNER